MSQQYVVFFDIDNCLYSASTAISHLMTTRIRQYFVDLGFPEEEAERLLNQYYRQYGLAIRGLVKSHNIDPIHFNEKCDDSLPLENFLKPDPLIRQLLLDIDRSKVCVWGATNAYITHAERVLTILGLRDLFEGRVSCDYADPAFTCKPEPEYYAMAMSRASLDPTSPKDRAKCLFIDDSLSNVRAARVLQWGSSVWFRERLTPAQRAHLVSGDEVSLTGEAIQAKVERELKAHSGAYPEQLKQSLDGRDTEGVDAVIHTRNTLIVPSQPPDRVLTVNADT
ncbi:hypothetical protein M408DRAFT_25854 [Serendipita vermifera MAFF 305830]|uniref:Pyrimidine 5'-nucleotidase n=1 Tax=Serendipita vermifera MAFF 305830 TaxID=933852 RepID=A0A0C2X9Q3_SERVB|nr:hypothetical protein M408DRAFT_25854 [Serendipita vermifera MAFF 305830]